MEDSVIREVNRTEDSTHFTYNHYCDMLARAKQEEYTIGSFIEHKDLKDHDDNNNYIILRHDVDLSLKAALRFASIEHELQIHATYFILLHSEFYNALDIDNLAIIKKIQSYGHEIGLHYDPDCQTIQEEMDLLGHALNIDIKSIARHKLTEKGSKPIQLPTGIIHAEPSFNSIKYLSDSSQYWREGCLCKHLGKTPKMQVLIHPEWWTERGLPWNVVLETILHDQLIHAYEMKNERLTALTWHRQMMRDGKV